MSLSEYYQHGNELSAAVIAEATGITTMLWLVFTHLSRMTTE